MPVKPSSVTIPLPKSWPRSVKSAMLHVISLAEFAMAYTRGWAANCPNARVRLKVEVERLKGELALRDEQERIKDARMERIPPHRRPNYPPPERMAILYKTEHSRSGSRRVTFAKSHEKVKCKVGGSSPSGSRPADRPTLRSAGED